MVKRVLKYLKGTATHGLIMKPDTEKGIECYVDAYFAVGYNQEIERTPDRSYLEQAT